MSMEELRARWVELGMAIADSDLCATALIDGFRATAHELASSREEEMVAVSCFVGAINEGRAKAALKGDD